MERFDVMVIGGGACGLSCAAKLAKAGKKIVLLEARDRLGGRIDTVYDHQFSGYVEAGAEFIHGDAPVTCRLLNEAGITYTKTKGEFLNCINGEWQQEREFAEQWDLLFEKLSQLKEDRSISSFLSKNFPSLQDAAFRQSVINMVEGYDAADGNHASAIALKNEWFSGNDKQYRITGGYMKLVQYLAETLLAGKGKIFTSTIAEEIQWKQGAVTVISAEKRKYYASKAVVAVPLAIMQLPDTSKEALRFWPALPDRQDAFKALRMGAAIKIILKWKNAFWEQTDVIGSRPQDGIGFIISNEFIPTWWTQLPDHKPILTGWLAGPKAERLIHADDAYIFNKAMDSLAAIFKISTPQLKENLEAYRIMNWTVAPFIKGGYAYATVASDAIKKRIHRPVEDTLFFAGEALYDGKQMGTVEAALASGETTAEAVLRLN